MLGALGVRYYWQTRSPVRLDNKYVKIIEQNVQRELKILYAENNRIKRTFQDNNNTPLVVLSQQLKHPFYIYKNEQLVFWSDYHFVPDYKAIAGLYKVRYTTLNNGLYVVHRSSFVTGGGSLIEIFCLLPIYYRYQIENAYVKSDYNRAIIPSDNIRILTPEQQALSSRNHIYSDEEVYLFSLEPTEEYEAENRSLLILSLGLFLLSALLGTIVVVQSRAILHIRRQHEYGFLLLASFLFLYRWILLTYAPEIALFEWDLFNPKLYASSQWSPSLGDLLLNVTLILILVIDLSRHYYKSKLYYKIIHGAYTWKLAISLGVVTASYWVLYQHFRTLSTIYTDSQINLDISQEINFSLLKIVCIIIFVLLSSAYFFWVNLSARLFIRLNVDKIAQSGLIFTAGTILYNLLSFLTGTFNWLLILIHGIYFLAIVYLLLPKFLYRFRYLTSIYLFLGALVCAISGTYSIYKFGETRADINKKKYAESLLDENDLYTEFILL